MLIRINQDNGQLKIDQNFGTDGITNFDRAEWPPWENGFSRAAWCSFIDALMT